MVPVEITAEDLNVVSLGDVYGHEPLYSVELFAAHVYRNQIDLLHSLRIERDGELISVALLAFRGLRAWVGGFGVAPRHRRHGLGHQCAQQMLTVAAQQGAQSIELEVLVENDAARRLYEKVGFVIVDELRVWRAPRRGSVHNLELVAHSETMIARIATTSPAWQREPGTIARSGPSALVDVAGAYAFVRPSAAGALILLDARAADRDAAKHLCKKLELGFEMKLLNESARSALTHGLENNGWEVVRNQYRMSMAL